MRYLFIIILSLFSAITSASTYYSVQYATSTGGATKASACQAALPYFQSIYGSSNYSSTALNSAQTKCEYYKSDGNLYNHYNVYPVSGVCPTPLIDDGSGVCEEPPTCQYGAPAYTGWIKDDDFVVKSCDGTCEIWTESCDASKTIVVLGVDTTYNHCSSVYGDACSVGTAPPASSPTEPDQTNESCAAGQTQGIFNGQTICLNAATGEAESTEPPKESTATENAVTTPPSDNGDGTSTETTITTNTKVNNGVTSTTTTTTTTTTDNSTGDVIGQTSDSSTTEHPDAPKPSDESTEEGESTYAANDCLTPISCTGDAIQCALAQQTKDTACLLTSPDPSEITALALGVPVEHQTIEEATEIDISGEIDTSTFIVSACPAPRDVNFNIGGANQTFRIDYDPFCEIAEVVGTLVIFTASIISIRTVGSF